MSTKPKNLELELVKYELFRAVRYGRLEKVKDLINSYGLSSEGWPDGYVLLRDALEWRRTAVAELLLRSGAKVNSSNTCKPSTTPLHYAARNGNKELVEIILDRGGYIDAKDSNGRTPLHHAVECGKIQVTELLLKHSADVDASDNEGTSPLHLAASTGSLEIVKELLKYGAFVNCVYNSGRSGWNQGYTPLLVAAKKGNTCIVEILLDHGACINSLTLREGYTPLHFACKHDFKTVVELLLKRGADVNAGTKETPLHLAVRTGNNFCVKLLLEHKARVDTLDEYGKTALQLAVEEGYLAVVKDVLKYCPDISIESNRSSLKIAVQDHREKKTKIVEALLEYGFNVRPEDANNLKLLHTAVERGYLKIVEDLLNHGADVNMPFSSKEVFTPLHCAADVNAQDKTCKTPIFYAIDNADLEMTKLLLTHQANINNYPNLLHIAVKKQNVGIVEALLQHGADVNASDVYARTALHFTCTPETCETFDILGIILMKNKTDAENKLELMMYESNKNRGQIAQLLLSNGANVDARTVTGVTTLYLAIKEQYTKVVAAVLEYNANVNSLNGGITPLHLAVENGHKEYCMMLINKLANVNGKTEKGDTPLHTAAERGNRGICMMLINKGANINAKTENGNTPIHLAAQNGHQEIIKTFLKNGANINTQDVNGKTALHFASYGGHQGVVVTLLENGADINITCKNNHTPLDYALVGQKGVYREVIISQAEALRRYMVQMKTANIFLSQNNLLSVNSSSLSSKEAKFQRDCEKEIANMKSETIKDLHISFYDILTKNTSLYMRNKLIVQDLKARHYKRKFPIYARMIESQFRNGMLRKALIGQANKMFHLLYPAVPCLCTEKIFSYLSIEDLRILLKAGRSLLK